MKTLVAYFSASGNTAMLAKNLAEAAGADLFEIRPAELYTNADLRWTNPFARCNKEKLGKKDVPVADKVKDFEDYDMIFIGFPVWYYAEPNIIDTFVKSYDFSDKKVALFATSGGSDITQTPGKLELLLGCKVIAAKLFSPDESVAELRAWAAPIMK